MIGHISELSFASVSKQVFVQNHSYGILFPLKVHFHANQNHFLMKGSVWSLVLKQRCKVTWKWPIAPPHFFPLASSAKRSLIFSSRNVHFVLHWISELITYSSFTLRSDWARANQRDHKEWHHYGMVRLEYLKFLRKGRIVWEKKRSFYKSKIIFAHLVPLFTSSLSLLFQELPVQSPPLWWVQTT